MKKVISFFLALLLCLTPSALADQYRDYYEIFVGSFYDSDGDGTGDLDGITKNMAMLTDLGVTGLWLTPIHPSPSYHKYDVTDYMDIDPLFGDMAAFERLASACEENDIALILDLVLNHTSSLHPWFLSAVASLSLPECGGETCTEAKLCVKHNPYCGYYHFFDSAGVNRHLAADGWYYEGVFGAHMPDLNLENEAVVAELFEIAAFWLDKGVSGFRLDAIMHYQEGSVLFNSAFIAKLKERFPNAYFVGEVWADATAISAYYESPIDSLFNYPFATQTGTIAKAIQSGNGEALALKIEAWQQTIGPGKIDAPFLSNHDNGRSAGYFVGNVEKEKLAAAIYLFMPGNPFIYYGEELGMTGSGIDENKRQPYLWSVNGYEGTPNPPPGCDQTQRIDGGYFEQRDMADSLFSAYRALLRAKKENPGIARGDVTVKNLGNSALCAYESVYSGKKVTIIHNLSTADVTFEYEGRGLALHAYGTMLITDSSIEVF